MTAPHVFPVTVYYEDTDMGGIVYHANYLKFVERARSDWVRGLGIDQLALRDQGRVFAVRQVDAAFLAPARLDEVLEVTTRVVEIRGARAVLDQSVARAGTLLFTARVTLACLDPVTGAARRLPAELCQAGGDPGR